MDINGLERLLAGLESGDIRVVTRDLTEPSPLAREVLTARPYAYLDDAPLEERRTQAVMSRRWLDPESASELGRLDETAIARVRDEAWPDAASADELHDAMVWLGFLTDTEAKSREGWTDWLDDLAKAQPRHSAHDVERDDALGPCRTFAACQSRLAGRRLGATNRRPSQRHSKLGA